MWTVTAYGTPICSRSAIEALSAWVRQHLQTATVPIFGSARTDVPDCLSAIACVATAEAGGPVHFVPGLVVTSFLGTELGTQPGALVDLKPIGKIPKTHCILIKIHKFIRFSILSHLANKLVRYSG